MTTCPAGCPAQIAFYKNDHTGRPAPVDLKPDPEGNVTINFREGTYHVLTKKELAEFDTPALFAGDRPQRFVLHFVTCANAPDFRRCKKCRQHGCKGC